jgi:hypothetical protein
MDRSLNSREKVCVCAPPYPHTQRNDERQAIAGQIWHLEAEREGEGLEVFIPTAISEIEAVIKRLED